MPAFFFREQRKSERAPAPSRMTLPVAVLAALTASAAAALTPSHGYAASFEGGRPIAAAVWRDLSAGDSIGFSVSATTATLREPSAHGSPSGRQR